MPDHFGHPTIEEYEEMDRIRFPFMFIKEVILKEEQYTKFNRIKGRRYDKDRIALEARIKKLIYENKEKFFDPILKEEICPIAKRNSGGWAKHVQNRRADVTAK